jgi:hypothetical protein
MPTGICAFPYPQGEPENLEAAAVESQLTEVYSALEPQPDNARLAILGTEEGDDSTYTDCEMEVFIAKSDENTGMCNENDDNKPIYSGSCKDLVAGGLGTTLKIATLGLPKAVATALESAINGLVKKPAEQ